MDQLPDGVLVKLFKEGNETAFECLLERYDFLIKKLTRKYFGHGYEPDDFYQIGAMLFLDAVVNYKASEEYSFYAFALSCVRNGLASKYRSMATEVDYTSRNQILSYVGETRRNYSALNSEFSDEADETLLFAYKKLIKGVLESDHILTPLEKKCFKGYVEGKAYEEIAVEVSESLKVVDNALTRCRRKLQKLRKIVPSYETEEA
ncbi:MAG: sigma-70 family RNA polymerase sigma factor [Turicibacter sp.]|nr:sigma-70 family RNA polymerase sigma factor [Turicibacter sp.]